MNNKPLNLPDRFSEVYGLGQPVAYHPATAANGWVSLFFGVLFLGGGGLLAIYAFFFAAEKAATYGPAVYQDNLWPFLILGGIGLLVGVGLLLNGIFNWGKAAVAYEKGLAYYALKGGLKIWQWAEVDKFFSSITKHYTNGIYTGTTYIYTLQKSDGEKLVLNNALKQVEQLGNFIIQNAAPIQYDKIVAAIRSGQTVTLGPVSISSQMLGIGKKTYPWDEIEQFNIQNGFINIKKKGGGWFSGASAPASAIPNLNALLAVINQVIGIK